MVLAEFEALRAEVAKLAHKVDQLAEVDAIMRGSMHRTGPEKLRSAGWHAAPVTCRQSSSERWCCCPRVAHDLNRQRIRRQKIQNSPIWLIAATEPWVATGVQNGSARVLLDFSHYSA